jgi:hypothetical protein
VPAIDGVAEGRILSIRLDGNDSVWLELLVNVFESEENCIGYIQNSGTRVPLNSECHRIAVCDFVAFWISARGFVGLLRYFHISLQQVFRSRDHGVNLLRLRLTAFRFPGRGFG